MKRQAHVQLKSSCWIFPLGGNGRGYSQVRWHGKKVYAHRLLFEALVNKIPHGMTIDHLCRRRNCANPAHLEVVTMRENVLRGDGLSALNAKKTCCKRGHPFTAANTRRVVHGARACRVCQRTSQRENRAHLLVAAGSAS